MKEKLKSLHVNLENFFFWLIELVLQILAPVFGIGSWIYPVANIWTDVIDGEFSLLKSLGYILVGLSLFYISSALYKINEKLKVISNEDSASS